MVSWDIMTILLFLIRWELQMGKSLFFNKEDIESIIFVGYINSAEQLFEEKYNGLVLDSGYKKIK